MNYAKSKEQKLKKRTLLLNEVNKMYQSKGFDEIKILDVANNCDVSKGTVFNYFESKETLFLTLLIREYGQWFDGLYQRIDGMDHSDTTTLIKVVTKYIDQSLEQNIRLFHLVGLGHSHLEHNVSLRMAEKYRRFLNDRASEIGLQITSKVDSVSRVQGIKMVVTLHTFFVGHGQMSQLPAIMLSELPLDELESYEIDYRVTMLETMKMYFRGLFNSRKVL